MTPSQPNGTSAHLAHLLSPGRALIICGIMSAALLGGAFLFEYVGGLLPCRMCIWQRWAHAAIIACALIGTFMPPPRQAGLGLILVGSTAALSATLAGYHAGVEWHLWAGPSGCTASLAGNVSAALLVDQLLATPVVRCDEVPWSLFGLSMAGWNMIFSLDILAVALMSLIAGLKAKSAK
ncbi:disulfide bond formation protein B [bacterium]|nr:disulfide bond formation protein B [bacterium]